MSRHVIIGGTGRAGTTFLVHLLTALGLDTGFSLNNLEIDPVSHAGLESKGRAKWPYIVKSPRFFERLPERIDAGKVRIRHAIIPVREFEMAARSRIRVSEVGGTTGGLWDTDDPDEQLSILYKNFALTFEMLAEHDIPVTLLWYPRLGQDPKYLYDKLRFLIPDVSFERFAETFGEIAKPELIQNWTDDA